MKVIKILVIITRVVREVRRQPQPHIFRRELTGKTYFSIYFNEYEIYIYKTIKKF